MRGWLQKLRVRLARGTTNGARRAASVYLAHLQDGRAVPGSLRQISPAGDFSQAMISACGRRATYWGHGSPDEPPRVWVSDLDGEASPRCVTREEGMQGHPAWHPDGVRLVYFASTGTRWDASRQFAPDRPPARLCWLDTGSGESRALTGGGWVDERPTVSPDGAYVVFVSNRSGRLNLWRVNADGTGLAALTDGPGPDYRPCVSPDGRTLAYFAPARGGSHQVRLRSLDTGAEIDCGWTERFAWSHGPYWCDGGDRLLVHALERGARTPGLWLVDPARSELQRLEIPGMPSASHGTLDRTGLRLVFDSRDRPA